MPSRTPKYLYGNKGAAVDEAITKQVPLRVSMQLAPDELRHLRDFMDLYDVAEPTHAFRLAVSLAVTTGPRMSEIQRLKMRVISNEIRDWLMKRASIAYTDITNELKAAGIASADELAKAQQEYAAAAAEENEP